MIDTQDLPSYIPGYDEYCEPKREIEDNSLDLADEYYEESVLRKEIENMRKIVNPKEMELTFEDLFYLEDYIWKGDKLIPAEMLEGK